MGMLCPSTIADYGAGYNRPGSRANQEESMNIFVGNLNWETTLDELEELFAPYGRVDRVQIATDRVTGRSRGFGFVEMPDSTQGQAAIDGLNGTSLGGRALTVNEARAREDRGAPRRAPRRERW